MDDGQARVHRWHFHNIAAECPRTAAACGVPLVVEVDHWWQHTEEWEHTRELRHRHEDFFALFVTRAGRGTHVIEGIPYEVSRGDVYVMGLGATHRYARCDDLVFDALFFAPDIFDQPTLEALADTPGFLSLFVEEPLSREGQPGGSGRWLHLPPDTYAQIAETLDELRAEWAAGTPSGALLARGLFLRLLVHLARLYARTTAAHATVRPTSWHDSTVAVAVRYMDAHFTEPLRMEQVASTVFLSADRFTEVFTRSMGRTPRDYLRYLRLERAKALLVKSDQAVAEVGANAGFSEPAYFTRVFRETTGMTPSAYRRQSRMR